MQVEQTVDEYKNIYGQLRKKLNWKVSDNRIIMTIASMYVISNKPFDRERFLLIAEAIRKKASLFSTLKTQFRFTMATNLDLNYEHTTEKIDDLLDIYNEFKNNKFKRGNFTYIAASLVLLNAKSLEEAKEIINDTKVIHTGMKRQHPFLTAASDYPLATILALNSHLDVDTTIERLDNFYFALANNSFNKGNDLQVLSHLLTLAADENDSGLLNRVIHVYDTMREHGIKPKNNYYTVMGLLAFLPAEEVEMKVILEVHERLNKQKHFKWQKDLNFLLAVSFFVSDKLENSQLIETNIFTTLEAILQVQHAIIVSSVVSATAVTSSNNNS